MTFRELLLEETTSGDIATVDNKLDLVRRSDVKCKKHNKQNCKICKITDKITESKNPEDVIRDARFKIKDIIRTKFGIQIDIINMDKEKITDILKDFKYTLDGKSVFIYN